MSRICYQCKECGADKVLEIKTKSVKLFLYLHERCEQKFKEDFEHGRVKIFLQKRKKDRLP
jgi:hypothetical protein